MFQQNTHTPTQGKFFSIFFCIKPQAKNSDKKRSRSGTNKKKFEYKLNHIQLAKKRGRSIQMYEVHGQFYLMIEEEEEEVDDEKKMEEVKLKSIS